MSYISAIRTGDDVLVWERSEHGRDLKTYQAPYHFYVKSEEGDYTSIYGDRLVRFDFDTSAEFQRARGECEASGIEMFESDIPPELKILSEHYYEIPAPKLHVSFIDIEVDYSKDVGFASVANPYAPINSIAIYHTHLNKYVVLAVPPNLAPHRKNDDTWEAGVAPDEFMEQMNKITELPEGYDVDVFFCEDERELLIRLLVEIEDSDVICGWNSDFFDVPYIGKRLEKIGQKFLRMLSFPEGEKPKWRTVPVFGVDQTTLDLSGRISADYMRLFQKYEMAERPSYKLMSIADEILPDLPKLEYEGSLAELYRKDFAWFVRYNIRDTEILHGLEKRLGYVELANQMMHMSTGIWKHVGGTLKLAELATINYCHHTLGGLIVNDVHVPEFDAPIKGAYVLEPKVGMHEWIGSVDINSLYPSAIRSINISPETIRGQFTEDIRAAEEIAQGSFVALTLEYENGEEETRRADEWRDILREKKWSVSGFGTVFDQNKQGIIPKILEDWYEARKEFQAKMRETKEAGNTIKTTYYDKLQYVYKIKLNSFYGALTNKYFRFYDLRMGESTTGTGRMVLRHQCAKANEILTGKYDPHGDAVIYGDTDSTYFETWAEDRKQAIMLADRIGKLVNDSFQEYMQEAFLCNTDFDDIIKCGREIVSDRGIFVDKKRYILHLIDLDGYEVDKLKVMGLDTKKTTMPPEVSKELNHFVERLLKGEEWSVIAEDIVAYKDSLETTDDIMTIGLPKGVKNVEKYTQELKIHGDGVRLPGHVAASIFYNICREEFEDKESMPIVSNMKIKVFYLSQKYGRFKSIAIPVDIEQVPKWFLNEFVVDRQAHIERLVDNPLQNILKAIDKDVPTKQGLVVDSLLDF